MLIILFWSTSNFNPIELPGQSRDSDKGVTKPGSAVRSVKRMRFVSFVPPHCHAFAMHTHTHDRGARFRDARGYCSTRISASRSGFYNTPFSSLAIPTHPDCTPMLQCTVAVHFFAHKTCQKIDAVFMQSHEPLEVLLGGGGSRKGIVSCAVELFNDFWGGFFRYSFLLHFTLAGYLLGEAFHS